VDVALWNAYLDQPSMGNEAFTGNRGLLNVLNGQYKLQAATHPVNIRLTADQDFISALQGLQYYKDGDWTDVRVTGTAQVTTDPKQTADGSHTFTYIKVFEIDLDDMTTQYIRMRVKVPYTPMGEDWIEARLKIEWSAREQIQTANGGSLTLFPEDVPLTQTDYVGDDFEKVDSATGVCVTASPGVIPASAELKVALITSGGNYEKAQAALDGVAKQFTLYDLTLTADEKDVQPDGRLTLYFPIPGSFDPSKAALYRINDDGTFTLIKGSVSGSEYTAQVTRLSLYALAEGYEAFVPAVTAAPLAVGSPADRFTDIAGHWAYNDIRYAVENGLFAGMSETAFSPDTPMTRGMFVTVLGRMASAAGAGIMDAAAYQGNPFTDLTPGQYYAPYVAWAAQNGIVNGVGDGQFAPNSQITREQMAVMLSSYVKFAKITLKTGTGVTLVTFADAAETSSWAKASVDAMIGAGILAGTGDGIFDPKGVVTRAQAAALLSRFTLTYVKK
jgi:hypothetical protein